MPTPTESADAAATTMFRNLSTSTKLILLCGAFIVAIAVAIYTLVAAAANRHRVLKEGTNRRPLHRGRSWRLLQAPWRAGRQSRFSAGVAVRGNRLELAQQSRGRGQFQYRVARTVTGQHAAQALVGEHRGGCEKWPGGGSAGQGQGPDFARRRRFEPRARSRSRQLLFARHSGKTDAASARPDRRYTRADWREARCSRCHPATRLASSRPSR